MRLAVPWVLANATPEEAASLRAVAPRLLGVIQDRVWEPRFAWWRRCTSRPRPEPHGAALWLRARWVHPAVPPLRGCCRGCQPAAAGSVRPPSGTVAQSMAKVTSPRRACASGHRSGRRSRLRAKPVLGWPARFRHSRTSETSTACGCGWPWARTRETIRSPPKQATPRRVDRRHPAVPTAARSGRAAAPGGRPGQQPARRSAPTALPHPGHGPSAPLAIPGSTRMAGGPAATRPASLKDHQADDQPDRRDQQQPQQEGEADPSHPNRHLHGDQRDR
jgi:hypothetical protein